MYRGQQEPGGKGHTPLKTSVLVVVCPGADGVGLRKLAGSCQIMRFHKNIIKLGIVSNKQAGRPMAGGNGPMGWVKGEPRHVESAALPGIRFLPAYLVLLLLRQLVASKAQLEQRL